MKKPQILESLAVACGVVIVAVIQNTELSNYSSYVLALLIIFFAIYISIKKRSKSASELFTGSFLEIFGVITVTLLIIMLTQGLSSPLFFFLYFILFLLAFIAESVTVWVFLASLLLYFSPNLFNNPTTDTFIKIGSLILITPIAYFIAKEFERRSLLNRRIESKTDEIIQEAQVLKTSTNKSADENEAIDEIIEEAESLKRDSE